MLIWVKNDGMGSGWVQEEGMLGGMVEPVVWGEKSGGV